jgi:hypothetical protein
MRRDALHDLFPGDAPAPREAHVAREANRASPRSAHQQRADDTTRVAREAIDKDTQARVAQVAKLKAQRLERAAADAQAAAEAAAAAPPKKARKKA